MPYHWSMRLSHFAAAVRGQPRRVSGSLQKTIVPFSNAETPKTTLGQTLLFGCYLVLGFAPAVMGLFFRPGSWYRQLEKPAGTPPPPLFAPVWATLYLCIGISGYLLAKSHMEHPSPRTRKSLQLFYLQLVLNALWPAIFFGAKMPLVAFANIVAMDATVAVLIALNRRSVRFGAWLLMPYLAWISYATYLNGGIVALNWKPKSAGDELEQASVFR